MITLQNYTTCSDTIALSSPNYRPLGHLGHLGTVNTMLVNTVTRLNGSRARNAL